ncbi:MAG: M3 family metallopeptidase [Rhizomicrobium sp.]
MRVWEVTRGGEHVGLFYGRLFRAILEARRRLDEFVPRPGEHGPPRDAADRQHLQLPQIRSRAAVLRRGQDAVPRIRPCVARPAEPVRYPRLAGTNVAQDFVELPSQIFEHWLEVPETLERFAVHAETGEPIPKALLEKLTAARNFNKGFATVEFLASAFVDLDYHALADPGDLDVAAFEAKALERIGMPKEIVMRMRAHTSCTSSPATAIRPATTLTCGPKCWMPMASRPSRRRRMRSIRRSPSVCTTTSIPRRRHARLRRRLSPVSRPRSEDRRPA